MIKHFRITLEEAKMTTMNESDFKTAWVAAFIATWTAINYQESCATGEQTRIENPPLEDAEYLALVHWQKWVALSTTK